MAPAACPVLLFDKIDSLMSVFMSKIKRINRQSSIRITAAVSEEGIHLVLCNEDWMFFPCETFFGVKRDRLFR